ncbi:MAG: hypothetical protein AAB284_06400, partial [Chloroflexota bacterium]
MAPRPQTPDEVVPGERPRDLLLVEPALAQRADAPAELDQEAKLAAEQLGAVSHEAAVLAENHSRGERDEAPARPAHRVHVLVVAEDLEPRR